MTTKTETKTPAADDTVLEEQRRSVVPLKWQRAYAKQADKTMRGTCADDVALELRNRTTKSGKLDLAALTAIGRANGFDPLERWAGKNEGMLRMNTGNVLRGMAKRGEVVVWPKRGAGKAA